MMTNSITAVVTIIAAVDLTEPAAFPHNRITDKPRLLSPHLLHPPRSQFPKHRVTVPLHIRPIRMRRIRDKELPRTAEWAQWAQWADTHPHMEHRDTPAHRLPSFLARRTAAKDTADVTDIAANRYHTPPRVIATCNIISRKPMLLNRPKGAFMYMFF